MRLRQVAYNEPVIQADESICEPADESMYEQDHMADKYVCEADTRADGDLPDESTPEPNLVTDESVLMNPHPNQTLWLMNRV